MVFLRMLVSHNNYQFVAQVFTIRQLKRLSEHALAYQILVLDTALNEDTDNDLKPKQTPYF